jgi:hypothetical protein
MMSAGPAPGRWMSPAAAVPMVAKIPAPITAPIPRSVICVGPRTLFKECLVVSASLRIVSIDLVVNNPRKIRLPAR